MRSAALAFDRGGAAARQNDPIALDRRGSAPRQNDAVAPRSPGGLAHITRREFLATTGTALVGLALPPPNPAKLKHIGLQLYTVRGEMARDFEGTLVRVAAIGYEEVEFAGYYDRSPGAVKAALDRAGLRAPSAHIPIDLLRGNWRGALEAAHVMEHRYLVVAWIPEQERTLDGYKRVAELFNRAGAEAHGAGIRFAYHNHEYEFAPLDGRVPYDVLIAATDPAHVGLEMDLYWITKGGGDPLAYFGRYPGRFPLVHVKDMDAQRHMVDVGRGVIDFKRIFAQRAKAGIRHYFVEHDEPADPYASIRASYDHLKRLEF